MQLFLLLWLAPVVFIAGGIVAGCIFVSGSIWAKLAAGCFFGAGAFIVLLGAWWTFLWLVH